jgi:hypothetical protein
MTTPPFRGFDFQDQLDSVARNLTGNQFRLSRTDSDAGQKFSEFLDRGAQAFEAAGRPQAAQMSVPNLTPPTVAPVVDQTRSAQPVFPVSQTPVDISTLREQASPALMSDLERSAAREISAFPTSPQQDHQNFIDHELFEASLVRDGVSPEEAHARAAERFGEGVDIQALTSEGSARLKELFGSDFNVDAFARSHEVRKAALAALGEGRPQTDPAGQRRAAILAEQQAQADARAAAQPSQSLISTFFNQTPLGRIALSASDLAQAQADEAAGAFRLAGGVLPDQILGREPIGLTQRETEFDRVFQEARSRDLRLSDAFREAAAVQQHLPVGEEQTGRHGVSGFLEGLGSALRGELGQTNIERQPLFEIGTADIGAAIADPLNVLPGVGEASQIVKGTKALTRGTKAIAGTVTDPATLRRTADRISPVGVADAAFSVPNPQSRIGKILDELPDEQTPQQSELFEKAMAGDAGGIADELGLDTVTDADVIAFRDEIISSARETTKDLPETGIRVFRGGRTASDIREGAGAIQVSVREDVARRFTERQGGRTESFVINRDDILGDLRGSFQFDEGELLVKPEALSQRLVNRIGVADAAFDEPTFSGIGSGDHVQRTRADRIKALASGELKKNFVEDLNIFADKVYRESDASEALRVIGGGDTQPLSEIFTACKVALISRSQQAGYLRNSLELWKFL